MTGDLGASVRNFRNGDKWYGNFLGKVPENPEIIEFPKSEPFNRKFRKFRDESQMERKFPGKIFRKCGYTSRGCPILRGTLGFSVLWFWLFFRSVFRFLCQKTSVFRFWCSLRFADFSFFSIWFSVFIENMSGFSVLLSDVLFRFSYFVLFGFRFLLDLNGN